MPQCEGGVNSAGSSGALLAPALAAAQAPLAAGIWTNTEDASFAGEEGRARPAMVMIAVGTDGRWRDIDAFGTP
jgi:hypothetical protein